MVNYAHLSTTQYYVAFGIGTLSMILSLFGSFTILLLSYKTNKWDQFYHRLICGLSVMDIIVTSASFVQPFLSRDDIGLPFAIGNATSCEWTAFFFQFFLGATLYNAALSIYYLLMVRYGMREEVIARYMEPYVHIIAFGLPLAFGVTGLILDIFNPSLILSGVCEFSPYPADCVLRDDIDCERGELEDPLSWGHSLSYMISALIGFVCTFMVYWTVRSQARKNLRYSVTGQLDEAQRKRVRAVGNQAILYILAFFNGFWVVMFMSVINAVYTVDVETNVGLEGKPGVFAANFLVYLCFPLQGFFNCCIYIRPRLIRWKDANQDQSWLWAFQQVLSAKPPPTTTRTAHLRSGPIYDRHQQGGQPPTSDETDKSEHAEIPNGDADQAEDGEVSNTEHHDSFNSSSHKRIEDESPSSAHSNSYCEEVTQSKEEP